LSHNTKKKSKFKKLAAFLGLVIGVIYILNPTFGVFELIPDNIPYVGNLDEASAVLLILACLKELKRKKEDVPDYQDPKNDPNSKLDD
jgi:hypothetical protein